MKLGFITSKNTFRMNSIKIINLTFRKNFARTNFNKSILANKDKKIEGDIIDITDYQKEIQLNQKNIFEKSEM